jgi:hypothetical protein
VQGRVRTFNGVEAGIGGAGRTIRAGAAPALGSRGRRCPLEHANHQLLQTAAQDSRQAHCAPVKAGLVGGPLCGPWVLAPSTAGGSCGQLFATTVISRIVVAARTASSPSSW